MVLNQKPMVTFSVVNKEHRRIANQFFSTDSWTGIDIRFSLDDQFLSVPHMMLQKLTDYYLAREFPATIKIDFS